MKKSSQRVLYVIKSEEIKSKVLYVIKSEEIKSKVLYVIESEEIRSKNIACTGMVLNWNRVEYYLRYEDITTSGAGGGPRCQETPPPLPKKQKQTGAINSFFQDFTGDNTLKKRRALPPPLNSPETQGGSTSPAQLNTPPFL